MNGNRGLFSITHYLNLLLVSYALLALFFPVSVYAVSYFVLKYSFALFKMRQDNGLIAISYFSALPFIGIALYLNQRADVKQSIKESFSKLPVAEYLGAGLLFAWYFASILNIYLGADISKVEVSIPQINYPISSLGLWFGGISVGFVFLAAISILFDRVRSKKW